MHRLGAVDAVRDELASGVDVAAESSEPGPPRQKLGLAPPIVPVDRDLPRVADVHRGELPVARLQFEIREVPQDSGTRRLDAGADDGAKFRSEHVARTAEVACPQELLAEQAAHRRRLRRSAVNGGERECAVEQLAPWPP